MSDIKPVNKCFDEVMELLFDISESEPATLHRYAVVDPAQDSRLPMTLHAPLSRCLLGDDDSIRHASPHLVALPEDRQATRTWNWIARHAPEKPCLILLTSTLDFEAVYQHLQSFLDVHVNKSTTMLLAWWDPMILATLLGVPDDPTLYVKGPVFSAAQRNAFMAPFRAMGYWDRKGVFHPVWSSSLESDAKAIGATPEEPVLPLIFQPDQVRQVVKAGLPDQVFYELRLNRSGVLSDYGDMENYQRICRLADVAGHYGIRGLRDLVNFAGAGMILGESFHAYPPITRGLETVQAGKQTFTDMLSSLPPEVLDQVAKQPASDGK